LDSLKEAKPDAMETIDAYTSKIKHFGFQAGGYMPILGAFEALCQSLVRSGAPCPVLKVI
jgi:hypothetical protein